jgi:hypothetical protein
MGSKTLFRPVFNNIVTGWAFFAGKKRRARCSTGLNNVLLPTLFTLVNNIEQYLLSLNRV